ncbi:hypothetical protein BJN43_27690 [Escherichia coli]|nr:hypothetical protein BJN43_27690 [Escherichia coli]
MAPGLNGKSWEPRGSVVHRGQEGIQVNAGRQVHRGQEEKRGGQRASEVFIPWGLMFWGS